MKDEHVHIISKISQYLEENPSVRFSQALFNLDINQFKDPHRPGRENYALRDIYDDKDERILERIQRALLPKPNVS